MSQYGYSPQIWPGFTPYEISKLVVQPQFIQQLTPSSLPFWRIWPIDNAYLG